MSIITSLDAVKVVQASLAEARSGLKVWMACVLRRTYVWHATGNVSLAKIQVGDSIRIRL